MRKEKGITLVALIITIIIMLILVAVSVNILVKSNLIGVAEKTANGYKTATDEETNAGAVQINGKKYDSIDDYVNRNKLQLRYREVEGRILLYIKNSLWDYVENMSTDEKDSICKKYANMTFEGYKKTLIQQLGKSEDESKNVVLGMGYLDFKAFVNEQFIMGLDGTAELEEAKKTLYMKKVKLTFPDNTTETKKDGVFQYRITENGDYKFRAESEDGQTDEVVVSINYPEKNIKIQIVEDKDIMTKISTQEELAAYLKQLPEQEPIQYTITSPRWTNIILNKKAMPDGRTFKECSKSEYKNQVLYADCYLLYYLDENDDLVAVKTWDEIQTEHTYFGLYTLIKR